MWSLYPGLPGLHDSSSKDPPTVPVFISCSISFFDNESSFSLRSECGDVFSNEKHPKCFSVL